MIDFIYVNERIGLGISGEAINVNERVLEETELDLRIKFSSIIEDFHVFSFGVGTLIITDLNAKSFIIKPCSGLLELYYFFDYLGSDSVELNYCVEEFFTLNQYDDEYCIMIKEIEVKGVNVIQLKNNNQLENYTFEKEAFITGLRAFSEKLLKSYLNKYPSFNESPIYKMIKDKMQKLA